MYKAYKLKIDDIRPIVTKYKAVGIGLSSKLKDKIMPCLTRYLNAHGALDGQLIMDDWFPQINADIFISHSHRDDEDVHSLAGWLYEKFGLISFIDADIWGYCNDLIWEIDRNYVPCYNSVYDYSTHNEATAHAHIMLMAALSKMIDKCECLFFLDTDHSVTTRNCIEKTGSPWIYNELLFSSMIKTHAPKRKPLRIQDSRVLLEKSYYSATEMYIEYPLEYKHMSDLNRIILADWEGLYEKNKFKSTERGFSLDFLYYLTDKK